MMKKYLIFLLFVLPMCHVFAQSSSSEIKKYTKADTLRGTLSPKRLCYNVLSYDLDVKVDIDAQFISGSNTIQFIAEQDFKTLQVDLFANMKIEKIEFNQIQLKYRREYNAVFVEFPALIKKGSIEKLKVYYSGNPQPAKKAPWDGGFSWQKTPPNLPEEEESLRSPWVGVSCQGMGASCWWPCKDHQSDEPENMFIRITVPNKLMAVSNGRLQKTTTLANNWIQYDWYVSYPINNYDVTLNISKYKHFSDTYINKLYKDSLTLDYYVLPENYKKAQEHFKQVKPMLDCYYQLFGEFPFVRDGYKLVETPYLGMEHQSCISYGNNYMTGYLGKDMSGAGHTFDYIIIHESAHEWWGNNVTTNDIADMWVHEGFATYAEALYVECMHGHDAYLKYINSEKNGVDNDEPIIGNYHVNSKGSNDMYPKGALLLHTIRSMMNDDTLFFNIIKDIQETFKYKTVNSSDIEKLFNEKSGKKLSDIFDVYLRSTSIPKLVCKIEKDSANLKVAYRYELEDSFVNTSSTAAKSGGPKGLFTMPAKITFKKDEYHFIYPTTLWKSMTIYNMKPEDFKIADDLFYIDTEIIMLNSVQNSGNPK